MQSTLIKIIMIVSLALNAVFIGFFVFALAHGPRPLAISCFDMGESYRTAAAVAGVPESGEVVFDTVTITLGKAETASLQFSVHSGGQQANLLMNALYDHALINVEQTGYGIIITALNAGETTLQTITNDGIRNVAHITIMP